MTRKQMLRLFRRDPTLLNALQVSLSKWTTLPKHWNELCKLNDKSPHYPCRESCAVCEFFVGSRHLSGCNRCVLIDTSDDSVNGIGCTSPDSPYVIASKGIDRRDKKMFLLGVIMMLNRLHGARRTVNLLGYSAADIDDIESIPNEYVRSVASQRTVPARRNHHGRVRPTRRS